MGVVAGGLGVDVGDEVAGGGGGERNAGEVGGRVQGLDVGEDGGQGDPGEVRGAGSLGCCSGSREFGFLHALERGKEGDRGGGLFGPEEVDGGKAPERNDGQGKDADEVVGVVGDALPVGAELDAEAACPELEAGPPEDNACEREDEQTDAGDTVEDKAGLAQEQVDVELVDGVDE